MAAHYAHTRRCPSPRMGAQFISFPMNARHNFWLLLCSRRVSSPPCAKSGCAGQGKCNRSFRHCPRQRAERLQLWEIKMYQEMREANGLAMEAHNIQRTVTSSARCFPDACSSQ